MSAWIVSDEHLRVMLWAGMDRIGPFGTLRWKVPGDSGAYNELTRDTAAAVGQMLMEQNGASVNYRYSESIAYRYSHGRPASTEWELVDVLTAIDCYEYQACETPDWEQTEAAAFCDALRGALVHELPGWGRVWGIGDGGTPPAAERAAA